MKDRNAAEARVKAAEEGLQRLNYDQTQEDGLAEEREREEHTVANLRVVSTVVVVVVDSGAILHVAFCRTKDG